ncbi:UNVERIFIED_CONTAM: hypothetical protein K2H54_016359 [Gekko kuhli]
MGKYWRQETERCNPSPSQVHQRETESKWDFGGFKTTGQRTLKSAQFPSKRHTWQPFHISSKPKKDPLPIQEESKQHPITFSANSLGKHAFKPSPEICFYLPQRQQTNPTFASRLQ